MPNVLILTDGAAHFTNNTFPGVEKVHILPWHASAAKSPSKTSPIGLAALPISLRDAPLPMQPPAESDFFQILTALGQQAHEIIVILTSSHLSTAFRAAHDALETLHCPAAVYLVDSQNIGAGLGLLVQAAAQAVAQGGSGVEVYRYIRKLVPHTYSLFCIQSLTYLAKAGHLDYSQAIVGEMLNLLPFFLLESGRLTPIQKVRSSRQLFEVVGEFIAEFNSLEQIVLAYGIAPFDQEGRLLFDRLESLAQAKEISAHSLNNTVAAVLGPRSLGISVMEQVDL